MTISGWGIFNAENAEAQGRRDILLQVTCCDLYLEFIYWLKVHVVSL